MNVPNPQSNIPPSLALSGGFGPGVITGKADVNDSNATAVNPGGVPIFYKNVVLGGIGVVTSANDLNVAEFAAFTAATTARTGPTDRFGPTPAAPGVVFIGGVALPFVNQTSIPAGFSAGPVAGTGNFLITPANSQGQPQTLPSDVFLGTLTAPIPASDHIGFFPVASGAENSFVGDATLHYGQNPAYGAGNQMHLGRNNVQVIDVASFDGQIPVNEATRVFAQFDSTRGENGHFVLYHEPGAADHARALLRTALRGPAAIGTAP